MKNDQILPMVLTNDDNDDDFIRQILYSSKYDYDFQPKKKRRKIIDLNNDDNEDNIVPTCTLAGMKKLENGILVKKNKKIEKEEEDKKLLEKHNICKSPIVSKETNYNDSNEQISKIIKNVDNLSSDRTHQSLLITSSFPQTKQTHLSPQIEKNNNNFIYEKQTNNLNSYSMNDLNHEQDLQLPNPCLSQHGKSIKSSKKRKREESTIGQKQNQQQDNKENAIKKYIANTTLNLLISDNDNNNNNINNNNINNNNNNNNNNHTLTLRTNKKNQSHSKTKNEKVDNDSIIINNTDNLLHQISNSKTSSNPKEKMRLQKNRIKLNNHNFTTNNLPPIEYMFPPPLSKSDYLQLKRHNLKKEDSQSKILKKYNQKYYPSLFHNNHTLQQTPNNSLLYVDTCCSLCNGDVKKIIDMCKIPNTSNNKNENENEKIIINPLLKQTSNNSFTKNKKVDINNNNNNENNNNNNKDNYVIDTEELSKYLFICYSCQKACHIGCILSTLVIKKNSSIKRRIGKYCQIICPNCSFTYESLKLYDENSKQFQKFKNIYIDMKRNRDIDLKEEKNNFPRNMDKTFFDQIKFNTLIQNLDQIVSNKNNKTNQNNDNNNSINSYKILLNPSLYNSFWFSDIK